MTREGIPVHALPVAEDRAVRPGKIPPGEVDLWYFAESHQPALEEPYVLNDLCVHAQEQARRFVCPEDRRRFIAGRLLLQNVLARYCECEPSSLEYSTGSFGKPALSSPPSAVAAGLQFNLSRSSEVVAVAVGHMPLGLDIEKQRPVAHEQAFLARQFSSQEQEYVRHSLSPRAALFEIWCRKEAYLKALGLGIFHPLRKCPVSPGCTLPVFESPRGQPHLDWQLRSLNLPLPGYAAALCTPAPTPCPHLIPLSCDDLLNGIR